MSDDGYNNTSLASMIFDDGLEPEELEPGFKPGDKVEFFWNHKLYRGEIVKLVPITSMVVVHVGADQRDKSVHVSVPEKILHREGSLEFADIKKEKLSGPPIKQQP